MANRGLTRFVLLSLGFCQLIVLPAAVRAQQSAGGEIVANLATGRVVFCVARDAIIVAATSGGGEVGSRPPAVLPVSSGRIGVLLGAIPAALLALVFDAGLSWIARRLAPVR